MDKRQYDRDLIPDDERTHPSIDFNLSDLTRAARSEPDPQEVYEDTQPDGIVIPEEVISEKQELYIVDLNQDLSQFLQPLQSIVLSMANLNSQVEKGKFCHENMIELVQTVKEEKKRMPVMAGDALDSIGWVANLNPNQIDNIVQLYIGAINTITVLEDNMSMMDYAMGQNNHHKLQNCPYFSAIQATTEHLFKLAKQTGSNVFTNPSAYIQSSVKLTDIVNKATNACKGMFDKNEIYVTFDFGKQDNIHVIGAETPLFDAVLHLFTNSTNALKATKNAEIEVWVDKYIQNAKVTLFNNGPQVDLSYLYSAKKGGIEICRNIMKRYDGSFHAYNCSGGGVEFSLELRLAKE
ncbi:HAMP domain-containing histidine kinase [Candidatus Woesearchaeota archaeon]|nr:HAMP domain-containing histidine kinase [Candidatus Woesearchaeota archaeon]